MIKLHDFTYLANAWFSKEQPGFTQVLSSFENMEPVLSLSLCPFCQNHITPPEY